MKQYYVKLSWRKWANKTAKDTKWTGPHDANSPNEAAMMAIREMSEPDKRIVVHCEIFSHGEVTTLEIESSGMYTIIGT